MLPLIILCVLASSHSFELPPGIVKISDTIVQNGSLYYNVATHTPGLLNLRQGTSLTGNQWDNAKVILSEENAPIWSTGEPLQDADINVIGPKMVRVYFSAKDSYYKTMSIGVAYAKNLKAAKEFQTPDKQIIRCNQMCNYTQPSLVLTPNYLYLLSTFEMPSTSFVGSSFLEDDGLSVKGSQIILSPDLHWEGSKLSGPWGFEKNGQIYVVYESEGGIGMARRQVDAHEQPFEKMLTPLLLPQKSMPSRDQLLKSLIWLSNGWPVVQF